MVNVDGFITTHTYEPVVIPAAEQIKKYLPDYAPPEGEYLNPKIPVTLGALATPEHYMEIRQELHDDLIAILKTIDLEYKKYHSLIQNSKFKIQNYKSKFKIIDNGLLEYIGPKSPQTIIVALGSVIGTIKDTI